MDAVKSMREKYQKSCKCRFELQNHGFLLYLAALCLNFCKQSSLFVPPMDNSTPASQRYTMPYHHFYLNLSHHRARSRTLVSPGRR